jgi:hypothetical protein
LDQHIAADDLLPITKLAQQYNYPKIMSEYIYPNTQAAWKKADGNLYMAPDWFSPDGFGSVG